MYDIFIMYVNFYLYQTMEKQIYNERYHIYLTKEDNRSTDNLTKL